MAPGDIGSSPQPDWLIDRAKVAGRYASRDPASALRRRGLTPRPPPFSVLVSRPRSRRRPRLQAR
jgi:hypothetical protein